MFKKTLTSLPLVLSLYCSAHAAAEVPIQNMMIQDLDTVKYSMEIKYAPKEWKQTYLGWNLESAYNDAKAQIYGSNTITSKDYQKILLNFLKSPRDYHVNALFFSTEWSFATLSVKKVGDQFYLSDTEAFKDLSMEEILWIDDMDAIDQPEQYEQAFLNLTAGDELIAIDNVPVNDAVEKIINEQFCGNNTETGYALAAKTLFQKQGIRGEDSPSGTFTITVRHKQDDSIRTYTLPWFHAPEKILNKSISTLKPKSTPSKKQELLSRHLKKDFKVHLAEDLLTTERKMRKLGKPSIKSAFSDDFTDEDTDYREKGFLPPLGRILWETDESDELYAYLYQNQSGKKIGYIYLPTFSYNYEAEDVIDTLAAILKHFNRQSDALVLDITNNPGGNLLFTYGVLSLLTDKPLSALPEQEILIQEDVYQALMMYASIKDYQALGFSDEDATLWGYPCDETVDQSIMDYCLKIVSTWQEGKTITDPIYCYGIEKVMPHPRVRYTKPILLLINELDFSCADLFPAILQDNGRATLFGKQTAGAGGSVRGYSHTSTFGVMQYSLTGSIAYRKNGNPLENLGVTPDISYDLTVRDLRDNYADYINAVNQEAAKLITR